MSDNIADLNATLDAIINDDNDIVSTEQILVMDKVLVATKALKGRMIRAERAGLNMGDRIKRLDDIDKQALKFLREYKA